MRGPNGKVHPAAAVFPMLAEEELAELAADIVANGLREPIALLPDGTLLDGRNRLAACERSGTSPRFTTYTGDDPAGYVLSANVHRRHMTAGARAMAVALVCLETKQTQRDAAKRAGANPGRVGMAGTVLTHAPELADVVLAGGSLDDAYATARDRKAAAESVVAHLAKLRAEAPDLADQVDTERLTLTEALAALRQRATDRADKRRRDAGYLREVATGWAMRARAREWPEEYVAEVLAELNERDQVLAREALEVTA